MQAIRFSAFTLLLPILAAGAHAQITFDSSFESGNGTDFAQVAASTYEFRIEPDTNSSDRQWFYFQVNGAEGQTLTIRLMNAGQTNVPSHWNTARPVASPDGGETWIHVTGSTSYVSNVYTFSHTFTSNEERIAFHHPYTYTMALEKIDEWALHPHAERSILGESVQDRPIWFFQVTADGVKPEEERLGIWIIARQHSAEVTSSFTIEAFMDFLLSDEPEALALRYNTILNIVPMVNPDGVVAGNYRNNYAGINLNRVWDGSATMQNSPEVVAIAQAIADWVAAGNSYVYFADFHSTSGANPHFAFHSASSVQPAAYFDPPNYHAHSRAFLALVNSHAPHFHPTQGASTSTAQTLAYHRQRIQYGVLAFTPEGAYNRQNYGPNSSGWMTPVQHREVGVAFAKALVDYYELDVLSGIGEFWLLH